MAEIEAMRIVQRAIGLTASPIVDEPARMRICVALRDYGDAMTDLLLNERAETPATLVDRHNAAYEILVRLVRAAGSDALAEA